MATLRIQRRALTLAIRGILSGVAITMATHGLIQLPQPDIEIPVIEVPRAGGGGGQYVSYLAEIPKRHRFTSRFVLVLDPQTHAWLSKREPATIVKLTPTRLRGHFDSRDWTLTLVAESEACYFDAGQDEEDLLIMMAVKWLLDEDDPFA
jgi:hypothetical protein